MMTARSVPEWIGKTPDTPIPPRVKVRIYDRARGRCEVCAVWIGAGNEWDADHRVALVNGGENRESNLQCLCSWCHSTKTRRDVAEKSRVVQRRKTHLGIRKAKQPIRGWRKFSGEPVRNPKLAKAEGRTP